MARGRRRDDGVREELPTVLESRPEVAADTLQITHAYVVHSDALLRLEPGGVFAEQLERQRIDLGR